MILLCRGISRRASMEENVGREWINVSLLLSKADYSLEKVEFQ